MAMARGADLWLDGGHNPHAARALARLLGDMAARDGRPTAVVCGLLANKDAEGFFSAFAALAPAIHAVGFEADAASPASRLASVARSFDLKAEAHADVTAGLAAALAAEGPPPHVVICGSLYLAGEVLALDEATWPR
jgi:dihydrofolate synthase/folylpolyglutamate synthase